MSEENVEIARRVCEAAWRRPKPDFETLNALVHSDHEMFTVQSLVEGGGYRGAEGFRAWLTSFAEIFGEDWECAVEEAASLGDDHVLVTGFSNVQGVGSCVPLEQRFWVLERVRDGKVARSEVHTDRDQAIAAARGAD